MARRPRRSRIASFQQPFLVGLLGSTAALGCGGTTDDTCDGCPVSPLVDGTSLDPSTSDGGSTPDGSTGGGSVTEGATEIPKPSAECPGAVPQVGTNCAGYEVGATCGDADGCGPDGRICTEAGTWAPVGDICNPPPPPSTHCPDVTPNPGASCGGFEVGLICGTTDGCDDEPYVECGETGVWEDAGQVSCNPPPPEPIADCPALEPTLGASCDLYEPGLRCEYGAGYCARIATCDSTSLQWVDDSLPCNPPDIDVGPALPVVELDGGMAAELPVLEVDGGVAGTDDAGTKRAVDGGGDAG